MNADILSNPGLDAATVRDFSRRNDAAGIRYLVAHTLMIAVAMALLASAQHVALQILWTLLVGILLAFLFAPLHESIHKTAFRSGSWNRITGIVCGLILLLPPSYFRCFHMAHHRHTQIQGQDPELDASKPSTITDYLLYMSGFSYWREQFTMLISYALGIRQDRYVSDGKYADVVKEVRAFVIVYSILVAASILFESWAIVEYWLLPMALGQPFLRGFLLSEHTLCPVVPDMLQNTRTTLTNRIVRRLCWNMNYHAEHHAWPSVPFHRLPEAHQRIRADLPNLDAGYLVVHSKILRSLSTESSQHDEAH
ncbi:MAG: fatty acid desaturase [Gammaproteobacteria bacterium]|nr:fatty acid desaturase [Gammaproteobacteria bacterium]MYD75222.1 fatty acid desaturase [Gammaproteobacteria bacterium]MYJ51603.1 fatty acid desaturase [Gammaproteobacteria bacterium]